jgi:hypothetical protein
VAVAVRGVTAFSDGLVLAGRRAVRRRAEVRGPVVVAAGLRPQPRAVPARLRVRRRAPGHHRQERLTGRRGRRRRRPAAGAPARDDAPLLWTGDYWLHPLPPPGNLVLGCRWPDRRIAETLVELDADPLLAAAATSGPIWQSS